MKNLFKGIFILVLIFCTSIFMMTTAFAGVNQSEIYKIDLNSDATQVTTITFDEMVREIALQTGDTIENVTNGFIDSKRAALESQALQCQALSVENMTDAEIMELLASTSYITVKVGNFPILKSTYQPKGLSFYGEGDKPSQDHTRMFRILNVVFDRSNVLSSGGTKQFSGNIYTNLEANDRIYYSVDGDFYENGSTTCQTGVNIGIGESVSISASVSSTSNHFAYINHNGRWWG